MNVKHISVCILLCSGETAFLSWECEAHLCVYFVMVKLPFCHVNVKHVSVCALLCSGKTTFLSCECEACLCVRFVKFW